MVSNAADVRSGDLEAIYVPSEAIHVPLEATQEDKALVRSNTSSK